MGNYKKTRVGATTAGDNTKSAGTHDKDNATPATSSILPANCDIFLYRHLFQQLEAETLTVFQRKLSRFQRLQTDLGRQGIFDWPEAQAKKLQADAAELKKELDTMTAWHDYLEGLTDFSIESWGRLSERCMILEEENAELRTRCRNLSKVEGNFISIIDELYAVIENLQTRTYNNKKTARHESSI